MVSLVAFAISCFVFIQFWWGIFNHFAFSNNVVLFIYFFVTLKQVRKDLSPITTQNIYHHLNYSKFTFNQRCISCFLHQCVYALQHATGDCSFYFVFTQSQSLTLLFRCNTCHLEHLDLKNLSWKKIVMKMRSFYVFSLPSMYLPSPFIGSVVSFSNSFDTTSFQMFLYQSNHSGASETLNDIV